MFNAITYSPEQNWAVSSRSLCNADIPDPIVRNAIDSMISRMVRAYLELIHEAKEKPETISDYKSSLYDYYHRQNMSLTSEIRKNVRKAQTMASDWKVITQTFSSERRISVFSEKDQEFDENRPLDQARCYIKFKIHAKDVKGEDALDLLLSQLSKKIFSLGYGDNGTFDIRLEKGCLLLEGDPWRWHFDGQVFKTSLTVCYSNKKNWSTRILDSNSESNGRPADHGFLYDALNVYHRAPIPSDLEGEELNNDDYRLFIRYNEFYTQEERTIRKAAKNKESEMSFEKHPSVNIDPTDKKVSSLLSEYKKWKHFLGTEQSSPNIPVSHLLSSQYMNHLDGLKETVSKLSEGLLTPLRLESIPLNFAQLSVPLLAETHSLNFAQLSVPLLAETDILINAEDNVLLIQEEMEYAKQQ